MTPPHLRGLTPDGMCQRWPQLPDRMARRIANRLVARYSDDLEGIPGLSSRLMSLLAAESRLDRLYVADRRMSAQDLFAKYVFQAPDGVRFESVRIPLERPRYSVCVSTQAGCPMGCVFCETGRMGLLRNLDAWEMVDQVLRVRAEAEDRPVTGVVFQGQGEPLLNYDQVIQAAAVLRDPSGGRIGADRITISTVGLPHQIERYTDDEHPYRLILSLTSTHDERRAALIPTTRRHPVKEIAQAFERHARARGGLVHVAWVLIRGLNTDRAEAQRLRALFPGLSIRVSLIDVTDPSGRFEPPGEAERAAFISALASERIGFIRRYSGGTDIRAACGQLASTSQGGTRLETRYSPTT